jgi:hypothetical protein
MTPPQTSPTPASLRAARTPKKETRASHAEQSRERTSTSIPSLWAQMSGGVTPKKHCPRTHDSWGPTPRRAIRRPDRGEAPTREAIAPLIEALWRACRPRPTDRRPPQALPARDASQRPWLRPAFPVAFSRSCAIFRSLPERLGSCLPVPLLPRPAMPLGVGHGRSSVTPSKAFGLPCRAPRARRRASSRRGRARSCR